ncbi:MAG: glycosyltransferase [Candidatus Edwardsbacteria bacterium]|nr:glycosyltransferase [Candidatus Edwardsbacteria bacterium]
MRASVIIPAYNAERTIGQCLEALASQTIGRSDYQILVVDDGSTDGTSGIVGKYPGIRLIRQGNAGPAAARNNGVTQAEAPVVVFTDSDCVPQPDWLEKMIGPLEADPNVTAVKGAYRTKQHQIAARFVQLEYEDKYQLLKKRQNIDFIDTYSAAFRRDIFLQFGGYDTSFKVACAEDVELSYRMHNAGHRMIFAPQALVYHLHPETLGAYFRKKYKFAYWRMLAVRKNPNKLVSDSHTPQVMKLQLMLAPMVILLLSMGLFNRLFWYVSLVAALAFLMISLPFTMKALAKDPVVGSLAPLILLGRGLAQFAGVFRGLIDWYLVRKS